MNTNDDTIIIMIMNTDDDNITLMALYFIKIVYLFICHDKSTILLEWCIFLTVCICIHSV